jgi:hypothetical protein
LSDVAADSDDIRRSFRKRLAESKELASLPFWSPLLKEEASVFIESWPGSSSHACEYALKCRAVWITFCFIGSSGYETFEKRRFQIFFDNLFGCGYFFVGQYPPVGSHCAAGDVFWKVLS